ncbi:class I SAM-dependent methyltransferase [Dehalococcoidia bacterium]|nr:class I SAM-dependent methyltransferase [Dehalococcoidia bacterium]
MNIKFWVKTALYRRTPGGFGYYRYLRRFKDAAYDHESEKHPVRRKHTGAQGWSEGGEPGPIYRDYEDYEEYVTHQAQKFNEVLKMYGGFTNQTIASYRIKFYQRFKHLPGLLPKTARILCLGARIGTEVEVLRDIGFSQAYGIDLNPGPDNRLVREGDFMHLTEETSSIDMVYSNCVDHAFNLDEFFAEHSRVLRPDGYALYDIGRSASRAGPFETVSWDDDEPIYLTRRYFEELIRVETEPIWKWVLLRGTRDAGTRDAAE